MTNTILRLGPLRQNSDTVFDLSQHRLRTRGTASRLVDRELTGIVTTTAKNQPKVSMWFYLINSSREHAVGAVQIRDRQTDITKCRNVSMMQSKRFAFLEFSVYIKLNQSYHVNRFSIFTA